MESKDIYTNLQNCQRPGEGAEAYLLILSLNTRTLNLQKDSKQKDGILHTAHIELIVAGCSEC